MLYSCASDHFRFVALFSQNILWIAVGKVLSVGCLMVPCVQNVVCGVKYIICGLYSGALCSKCCLRIEISCVYGLQSDIRIAVLPYSFQRIRGAGKELTNCMTSTRKGTGYDLHNLKNMSDSMLRFCGYNQSNLLDKNNRFGYYERD